jgi:hypothetical protein
MTVAADGYGDGYPADIQRYPANGERGRKP